MGLRGRARLTSRSCRSRAQARLAGVHHPDLEVAVTMGRERDAGTVRDLLQFACALLWFRRLARIQGPNELPIIYIFLSTYIATGDILVSSRHSIESSLEPSGL